MPSKNAGAGGSDPVTGTTARVLHLLGLLQSRTLWTGAELAERLGVTQRSVRRDVDRLRGLGYPVKASRGAGGGYQLGAGRSLPPLLLDPEEAVAVAVSLSLAAGGSVAGVDEAALRALSKLDQVLPVPLRERVSAVQESTVAVQRSTPMVDPETLTALARACRDRVVVRLDYRAASSGESQRRTEPYRVVSLGQRWYLMAYDLDREDWRSFRLDRITALHRTTFSFRPREAPDAATYVQRSVTHAGYRVMARVRLAASAEVISERVPAAAGTVTPLGDDECEFVTGADTEPWIAMHLAALDVPMTILEPPGLLERMHQMGARLTAAAGPDD